MKKPCCPKYAIAIIVLLAFGLRAGAAVWWQSRLPTPASFQFGDSHTYWTLAKQIQNGEPYQFGSYDRIFRVPGYPLMLAGLFQITGSESVLPARLLGAAMGALSVGLLMLLAAELFGMRAALATGILAAFYPGAIAMSILILSESPFCPWMLAHVYCWVRAIRGSDRSAMTWATAGGVLAGMATLVRPSWLLFTPFAAGLSVLFGTERRRHLGIAFMMVLGLCITMSPWWLRNYRVCQRFVPTTLQVGASLYDGINPEATGASNMRFMTKFRHEQQAIDAREGNSPHFFEWRLNERLKQAAIAHARENPGEIAQLMGVKLARMWSPLPNAEELQSVFFRLIVAAGYLPLLLAAIWGVWRFGRKSCELVLCWLPAVYFSCLHVIFVSSIRYRLPAMLVLTVFAGAAIVSGWRGSESSSEGT